MFGFDDLGIPGDEEKKRKKKAGNPLTPATTGGGVDPSTGLKRGSGEGGASTLGGSTIKPLSMVKDADLLDRLQPKKKRTMNSGLGEVKTPDLSKPLALSRSLTQQPPERRDAVQPQTRTTPSRPSAPQTLGNEETKVPDGVHNSGLHLKLSRDLKWDDRGGDGVEDALSYETDESKLPPALSTSPDVIRANDPSVSENDAYSLSMRNRIQLDINKMRQQQGRAQPPHAQADDGNRSLGHEAPDDPAGRGPDRPSLGERLHAEAQDRTGEAATSGQPEEKPFDRIRRLVKGDKGEKRSPSAKQEENEKTTYLGRELDAKAAATHKKVVEDGAPMEVREILGYLPDDMPKEEKVGSLQRRFDKLYGEGRYTVGAEGDDGEIRFTDNQTGRELPINDPGWSMDDLKENTPELAVWLAGKTGGVLGGTLGGPAGAGMTNAKVTFMGEMARLTEGKRRGYHTLSNKEMIKAAGKKALGSGIDATAAKKLWGTIKKSFPK